MKWHKYPDETPPAGTMLLIVGWTDYHVVYYSKELHTFRLVSTGSIIPTDRVTHWLEIENPTTHEK